MLFSCRRGQLFFFKATAREDAGQAHALHVLRASRATVDEDYVQHAVAVARESGR